MTPEQENSARMFAEGSRQLHLVRLLAAYDALKAENERLRAQVAEATKAIWAIANDGWLYCGDEGYDEAQKIVIDYTKRYPDNSRGSE